MDDRNASGDPTDYKGVNNGSAVGGASYTSAGKLGGAFEFDGIGDYVDVGSDSSLDVCSSGFTFSAWINYDITSDHHSGIIGGSGAWNDNPYFSITP